MQSDEAPLLPAYKEVNGCLKAKPRGGSTIPPRLRLFFLDSCCRNAFTWLSLLLKWKRLNLAILH